MAPQKRMMLKADVNRIYDEEVYSEQKIREEKFFVRPTRQRKMKKGKLFSVGMGLDLPFCIIILVLLTIGMIMMFSASYAYAYYNQGDSYYYLVRQLIFAVIGVGIMFVLSFFNYNKLTRLHRLFLQFHICACLWFLYCPAPRVLKDGFLSAFLTFSLLRLQSLQLSFSSHIGAVNTIIKCNLPVTAFCRV